MYHVGFSTGIYDISTHVWSPIRFTAFMCMTWVHFPGRDVPHAEEQPDQTAHRGGPRRGHQRPGGDHAQEDGNGKMFIFIFIRLNQAECCATYCLTCQANFIVPCVYNHCLTWPQLTNSCFRLNILSEHKISMSCFLPQDHDSRLSYADFEKAVRDENLLLEAFGT